MATDRINEAETYLGQKAWSSASSGRTIRADLGPFTVCNPA